MATKRELRERVRETRRMRGIAKTAAAAAEVETQLLALTHKFNARTVACFASTPLEPPTGAFLERAREQRIRVLLPRAISDTTLEWAEDTGELQLHSTLRVPEPMGPADPRGLDSAELIILPAAGADLTGTRLGWGGGYYDRALAALPLEQRSRLYALVHDDEIFDALPREAHDVPVVGIVTPSQVRDVLSRDL